MTQVAYDFNKLVTMTNAHPDAKMIALGFDGFLLPLRIWTLQHTSCRKCGATAVRLRYNSDAPPNGPYLLGECAGCGASTFGARHSVVTNIGTIVQRVNIYLRAAKRAEAAGKDANTLFDK